MADSSRNGQGRNCIAIVAFEGMHTANRADADAVGQPLATASAVSFKVGYRNNHIISSVSKREFASCTGLPAFRTG
jgi:hypothetical protein